MKVMTIPVKRDFKLKTDPDGLARVSFKQSTFGIERRRAELYKTRRMVTEMANGSQMRVVEERDFNPRELAAWDMYLTLCDASGFKRDDGEEAFAFDADGLTIGWDQFLRIVDPLTEEQVNEMYGCCLEVNPHWGIPKVSSSQTKTASSPPTPESTGSDATSAEPETP